MLSSCLDSWQRVFWNGRTVWCKLLTALCCPGAFAAETYFQPGLSARAAYNTNRNLATDSEREESIPGYRGLGPRK